MVVSSWVSFDTFHMQLRDHLHDIICITGLQDDVKAEQRQKFGIFG